MATATKRKFTEFNPVVSQYFSQILNEGLMSEVGAGVEEFYQLCQVLLTEYPAMEIDIFELSTSQYWYRCRFTSTLPPYGSYPGWKFIFESQDDVIRVELLSPVETNPFSTNSGQIRYAFGPFFTDIVLHRFLPTNYQAPDWMSYPEVTQ